MIALSLPLFEGLPKLLVRITCMAAEMEAVGSTLDDVYKAIDEEKAAEA